MTEPDPTLRPAPRPEDKPMEQDRALRPERLTDFIGQAEARANLRIFIESARRRNEAMDHVLFHGPPGLGQNHAGADHGARAGGELSHDVRAGAGQSRRSGRDPDQS